MLRIIQCGATVEIFYSNTIAENMILIRADKLKQYRDDTRLRLAVYTLSLPNIKETERTDIYDWMPLQYDPTVEERKQMKEIEDKKEEQKYLAIINRILKK